MGTQFLPPLPELKTRMRHKYKAKPTVRDGIRFASKKEATYFDKLKLLQKAGEVILFLRQVPFDLLGGLKYRADFLVFYTDGHCEVIDVKGFRTKDYILKKKLVESLFPVEILEV